MSVIANLVSKFTSDTAGFDAGAGRVTRGITGIRSGLATLAAGGTGFALLAKNAIDTADKMQKMSMRLGISTEALSELRHVAELSGVEFNSMSVGLQRMTRRIGEVAQFDKGAAKEAINELGLSASELVALAPDKQFEKIADALAGVENQSVKVALAMKFFDTEGVALIQTMGKGSAGIREMREEAAELGLSIGQDQADAAAKANDAFARLAGAHKGLMEQFALSTAGPLADFVTILSDVLPRAIDNVKKPFQALGTIIGGFAAANVQSLSGDLFGAFNTVREVGSDVANIFTGPTANGSVAPASPETKEMVELLRENNRHTKNLVDQGRGFSEF